MIDVSTIDVDVCLLIIDADDSRDTFQILYQIVAEMRAAGGKIHRQLLGCDTQAQIVLSGM